MRVVWILSRYRRKYEYIFYIETENKKSSPHLKFEICEFIIISITRTRKTGNKKKSIKQLLMNLPEKDVTARMGLCFFTDEEKTQYIELNQKELEKVLEKYSIQLKKYTWKE